MQLFIDGRQSSDDPVPDATIDEVLDSIRKENARRDRAILAVVCDGIDVSGPDVDDVLGAPASQYQRIEVQTGDPRRMIADALDDASTTLETVDQKRIEVIARCAEGKTGQAMGLLSECVGCWHQVNSAITQSLALLNSVVGTPRDETDRLVETLRPVQSKLQEVKEAVASKDFVSLADILEYEFADVSQCWQSVIDTILERVQRTRQPTDS
ncbi:MAG: hypothetical protein V3W34_07950 [Phycisphaerae bacterium]